MLLMPLHSLVLLQCSAAAAVAAAAVTTVAVAAISMFPAFPAPPYAAGFGFSVQSFFCFCMLLSIRLLLQVAWDYLLLWKVKPGRGGIHQVRQQPLGAGATLKYCMAAVHAFPHILMYLFALPFPDTYTHPNTCSHVLPVCPYPCSASLLRSCCTPARGKPPAFLVWMGAKQRTPLAMTCSWQSGFWLQAV